MYYVVPRSVALTEDELDLYNRIPDRPSWQNWKEGANVMEALMRSLFARNAIPIIRQKLFSDPKYAELHETSPKQLFERHGAEGEDIIRHPNFVPYLRHMISGPDLPKEAISGLCDILNEDVRVSGELVNRYCKHARDCVRSFRLSPPKAAREFFRLAIEVGMSEHGARLMRKAARTAGLSVVATGQRSDHCALKTESPR